MKWPFAMLIIIFAPGPRAVHLSRSTLWTFGMKFVSIKRLSSLDDLPLKYNSSVGSNLSGNVIGQSKISSGLPYRLNAVGALVAP